MSQLDFAKFLELYIIWEVFKRPWPNPNDDFVTLTFSEQVNACLNLYSRDTL